jgi:hypothetical protein
MYSTADNLNKKIKTNDRLKFFDGEEDRKIERLKFVNNLSCLNFTPQNASPTNYNINLEREILTKINKLKTKKNQCQVESFYLEAALKLTKQEI